MREIRGWSIGEVVTANYMTLNTANLLEEIGATGKANLPCIYNGLTLLSQSGTGNSIVTLNPGVCRCQDLQTSVYTYLPSNAYGNSYPCYIDISTLDANNVITLSNTITSGYIVATFAISPTSSGAVNYVITGSLLQIATASYNPALHVKLCAFTYALSTFTLDFTATTNRDTDLTGLGGVNWNYQTNTLDINIPPSLSGTTIRLRQNANINGTLTLTGNEILSSGVQSQFYNAANTFYTSLQAGTNVANYNALLPIADATNPNQALRSVSNQWQFSNDLGNIAANDSNVTFLSTSNRIQICTPTATRTYTLPTTGILAGDQWTFVNTSSTAANYITLQSSGANTVTIIPPLGSVTVMALVNTPTTAANWLLLDRKSSMVNYAPTYTGLGTVTNNSSYYKLTKDFMFIQGAVTPGTTTGVLASISLPSGFSINASAVALNNLTNNSGSVLGNFQQQNATNTSGYLVGATASSTTQIYFSGGTTSANGLTPTLATTILTSNNTVSWEIRVPVL